jgi:hypothetical protein
MKTMTGLREELTALLNRHGRENASDTPDFILTEYLLDCLKAFERARRRRHDWATRKVVDRTRARIAGRAAIKEA